MSQFVWDYPAYDRKNKRIQINMNQFPKDLELRREMATMVWMCTECDITPKHKGTLQQVSLEAVIINKDVGFILTAIQFCGMLILI